MDHHGTLQNSGMKKRKQEQDGLVNNHENSMIVGESSGSVDLCKSSTSGSLNSNNPNGSNSDISCQDDDDMIDDDEDEDPDYGSDFYYNDDVYADDYSSMQDQFDSVDLPPGVEASLPWLKDIPSSECKHAIAFAHAESSSKGKVDVTEDTVMQKFGQFKQFDTVDSYPDHYYDKEGASEPQRPKNWAKKIQEEWKILEENLPETIFVRVCESRMELLRAVIIGPQGTPYHDGLFFFDCLFPSTYPAGPPKVHYHSGGLRLNPNLYQCGKVCLSLLGTWHGRNSENWIPEKSTMLQVLVSIQALILNEKPFFNEPGYSSTYTGAEGQRRSKEYNENTFIYSLKTMMYTLRKPPKHFEDLVAGHFRTRAYDILTACSSYVEGAPVGSVVHNLAQSSNNSTTTNSQKEFQSAVSRMMNTLIAFFTKNGSMDCEEFRSPEIYSLSAVATSNLEIYKIETGTALTQV
ncbi:putative ubiquitin-conjugating enzyme E2 38 [Gastrolobium bilobum]|uniref:putative ubiquitin-conjugating enzyme E2 38 n=1 Tax=Gastrolobium bilobum TaxID=150636 RepID=UPI002AAF6D99|nr:putative ubiquitin-conjugating enzyme E2 38 [Gastrolobium bilobum]